MCIGGCRPHCGEHKGSWVLMFLGTLSDEKFDLPYACTTGCKDESQTTP